MPNATARKFGYPDTCIAQTEHWLVLLRPRQVTLGSLVLVATAPVQAFGALPAEAFAAMQPVVAKIERMLKAFVDYERINYLMLMMVDRDVHFHVLPRYEGLRTFEALSIADGAWPGPPALDVAPALDETQTGRLAAHLRALWAAL